MKSSSKKRKNLIVCVFVALGVIVLGALSAVIAGKAIDESIFESMIHDVDFSNSSSQVIEISDTSFVGGNFAVTGGFVTLRNCSFSNATIDVSGGELTIDESVMSSTSATTGIDVAGGVVNVVDTSLAGFGNAIHVGEGAVDVEINLLGCSAITNCTNGVIMQPYVSCTLNIGHAGSSAFDQFSGHISDCVNVGVYSGYYATTNFYSGSISGCGDTGIFLFEVGNLNMYGDASIQNCALGVSVGTDSGFTMNGGTITGNGDDSSTSGGGVFVNDSSTFAMTGGMICGNRAKYGAGIYNEGTCSISGGTITENIGEYSDIDCSYGGGIYNMNEFVLSGGTITGNYAMSGGGICSNGYFEMSGGSIAGNECYYSFEYSVISGSCKFLGDSEFAVEDAMICPQSSDINGTNIVFDCIYILSALNFSGGSSTIQNSQINSSTLNVASSTDLTLVDTTLYYSATIFLGGSGSVINLYGNTNIFGSGKTGVGISLHPYGESTLNIGHDGTSEYPQFSGEISGFEYGVYSGYGATTNLFAGTIKNNTNGIFAYDGGDVNIIGGTITGNTGAGLKIREQSTGEIRGGTISSNNSTTDDGLGGGVLVDLSSTFVMSGGTISANTATQGGGIYNNGTLNITGGSITGNQSAEGAGVFNTGTATMSGGSISSNISNEKGGSGVYNESERFTFSGGTIKDNNIEGVYIASGTLNMCGSATIEGSKHQRGVYVAGGTFDFDSGTISGAVNQNGKGGGIYVYSSGTLDFGEDSGVGSPLVTGNSAKYGGGVYLENGATLKNSVSGARITNNAATEYGGGIYFAHFSSTTTITLPFMTISGNTAESGGGGLFARDIKLVLSGTTFSNNSSASGMGGGVYFGTPDGTTLSGTLESSGTFTKNSAVTGGGIYVRWATLKIIGGTIGGSSGNRNFATNNGGGVFITNGTFTMSSGTISYNYASGGGGIYFGSSNTATISGGTISYNTATDGGGICVAYSNSSETVTMSGGTISNNSATSGGGVYVSRADSSRLGRFTLSGGTIISNTASDNGGGIYNNGRVILSSGTIGKSGSPNTATNSGGGVFGTSSSYTSTYYACNIMYNVATSGNGGGICSENIIYGYGAYVQYNKATNGAGGGIYVKTLYSGGSSSGYFSGSFNVSNNSANLGGGLAVRSSATLRGTSSYNAGIGYNTATDNGGGILLVGATLNLYGNSSKKHYIQGNTAVKGGGVFAGTSDGTSGSTINVQNTYFDYNVASTSGGGLCVYKSTARFDSGTWIRQNYVNATSGTVYGGGISVDSSSARFNSGSYINSNYIKGSFASALGGGVFVEGDSAECTFSSCSIDGNYITSPSSSTLTAGGNIAMNSNVQSMSFSNATIYGLVQSGSQAKFGGGIFISTPEYGFDTDEQTIRNKCEFYNTTIDGCVAEYGGAIASIGSFMFEASTITGCNSTNNDGIADAIFLAGVLILEDASEISGDIAVASNESGGTHRDDTTLPFTDLKLPYRTGSIKFYNVNTNETYELSFCRFSISVSTSLSITYSVTNSSTYCDNFFVSNGEVLVHTYGNNYTMSNYFTLPSGYSWVYVSASRGFKLSK